MHQELYAGLCIEAITEYIHISSIYNTPLAWLGQTSGKLKKTSLSTYDLTDLQVYKVQDQVSMEVKGLSLH